MPGPEPRRAALKPFLGRSDAVARTGVVLAQLGGPKTLEDVRPFIRSIIDDPCLVPLPGGAVTRRLLSSAVSLARSPRVRSHYAAIGGGSPILSVTDAQAVALREELGNRDHDVNVVVAQRHAAPDTEAAVAALLSSGVDRVVLLPLFPQYSATTTGSSEKKLRSVMSASGLTVPLHVVRSWCDHPSYLDAQARLVDEILVDLPEDADERPLVVFSAHGLPQRVVDGGDPYLEEIESTVAGVAARLGRSVDHTIAFQSRAGPVKWLAPDVRDVVASAGAEGRRSVVVVPISFVSDHLETLYELDIDLKRHAAEAGVAEFRRSRCFDSDPGVGPMLADIVEEHL